MGKRVSDLVVVLFFQAEDGIRDLTVTGVQTCALPICTLLIVSHDRYFLDRIISRLLYLRDGTCTSSAGNYTDYQAHLAAQTAAPQPAPGVKKTSQGPARLRPRPAKRRKPSVIEDEIHHIEAEIATVQTAIEAHDGTDWQRLTALSTQQGTLTARLESLLEEWEESMATEGS